MLHLFDSPVCGDHQYDNKDWKCQAQKIRIHDKKYNGDDGVNNRNERGLQSVPADEVTLFVIDILKQEKVPKRGAENCEARVETEP